MTRILIAGVPRAGKTYLAERLARERGLTVQHTDDLISMGWSESSEAVSVWMEEPGPFVLEGVSIPRALRKWLLAHETGIPADVMFWGATPREPLSKGQAAMGKGCETVWAQVRDELVRRGMRIECF